MGTQSDVSSKGPEVRLVQAFDRPYENAVATARTCYSRQGIVRTEDVSPTPGMAPEAAAKRTALRDRIASSTFAAGHHTTLQHAHFQFSLDGVSRFFLWTFLHSHPFYNSEQVSQRYVEVGAEGLVVPPLEGEAGTVLRSRLAEQMAEYRELIELLTPVCERAYFERFKSRARKPERYAGAIRKRAQEIARYVLPLATQAYLYHTVSGITLMRYWRLSETYDAPREQREVVGRMVELLLEADPHFEKILQEPLPLEETPEFAFYESAGLTSGETRDAWARAFDEDLGDRVSRLVDHTANAEATLAQAVRDVLGVLPADLDDDAAIAAVLDPSRNRLLGETMNVTTLAKLTRTLHHPSFTFRKRLSHTADSQDQRHRMTPASRPCLPAYLSDAPDFVTPGLVREDDDVLRVYEEGMSRTWAAIRQLKSLGVADEDRAYVLPNAVAIRFNESSDLLNLHHKMKMRLCFNAQEEIWAASRDEAEQVAAAHPRIGRWLLPPCALRYHAGRKPPCPEGDRFCGVRVWRLEPSAWERTI